jgi:hypothetical protein
MFSMPHARDTVQMCPLTANSGQSKIEFFTRMLDSNFATIEFPRFFGSDPGGSTAISGIQDVALTMPVPDLRRANFHHLRDTT